MRTRLRKAGRVGARLCGAIAEWVTTSFDKEDVLTLVGLGLVATGLWWLSHAAALIVPGVILLWMFVPSRPPLIERPRERRPTA